MKSFPVATRRGGEAAPAGQRAPLVRALVVTISLGVIAGCSQAAPDTPARNPVVPARTASVPVTLQSLEDALALEPGDRLAFNHVVERLILLQAKGRTEPVPQRRTRWLQRRALRTIRNVELVDTPTAAVARCDGNPAGVTVSFHTVRQYTCRVRGLSAAQADRLLRQSGCPAEVVFRFVMGVHGKHVAGLAVQCITLGDADKIVLEPDQFDVSPDTARAYEIYRQGLDLQQDGKLADALTCFEQSLSCDAEAAAILNHIAWFRATTDAERHRDPQLSLKLALRALKTCETFGTGYLPDILDTAARACYENGQYANALQFEQDALRHEPRNRSYRDQLDMIRSKLATSARPGD